MMHKNTVNLQAGFNIYKSSLDGNPLLNYLCLLIALNGLKGGVESFFYLISGIRFSAV